MTRSLPVVASVLLLFAVTLVAAIYEPAGKEAKAAEFTLNSLSVELPMDEASFADRPGADAMNNNCLACHSNEMVHYQPKLSRAQWEAIVKKMQDVYKAHINENEVPTLITYLTSMPSQAEASESVP